MSFIEYNSTTNSIGVLHKLYHNSCKTKLINNEVFNIDDYVPYEFNPDKNQCDS